MTGPEWIFGTTGSSIGLAADPLLWVFMLIGVIRSKQKRWLFVWAAACSMVLGLIVFAMSIARGSRDTYSIGLDMLIARFIAALLVGFILWWLNALKKRLTAHSERP